jgi:hypothetical protein
MRRKTYLIVRDKPVRKRDIGPSTRGRFQGVLEDGGDIYFIIDNPDRPDDGWVYSYKDLTKVAYTSYDGFMDAMRQDGREVEDG